MKPVISWLKHWKLVSIRTAVVITFVAYTLAGFVGVPAIIKMMIERQSLAVLDRQATVERVRCNPFILSLTIDHFALPDRPGSTLVAFDSLYANAQLSSIFRWAVTLKELTIDDLHIGVRRFGDGTINFLEMVDAVDRLPKGPEKKRLPPAILQKITINGGRLTIEDRFREHPLVWHWEPIDFSLHHISTIPDEKGDNAGTIGLPAGGSIAASGSVVIDPFGIEGTMTLNGLSFGNIWQAVEELFEFELTEGRLDAELQYSVSLLDDGPHIAVTDLNAEISNLGFSTSNSNVDLLSVDSISATGVNVAWPEQEIYGESLTMSGASVFAWMEPDGTRAWDEIVPEATQERIAVTYETLEEKLSLKGALARFEIHRAAAVFEDRRQDPPIRFETSATDIVVTDISTQHESMWPFEATTLFSGQATGSASGSFGASPPSFQANVEVDGLNLSEFQPYIVLFAPVELRAGVLSARGDVAAASGNDGFSGGYKGSLGITHLDLKETLTGDRLIGWGDLSVDGIDARLQPLSLDVASVDIIGAGLDITVAPDGTINLLEFLNHLSEDQDAGYSTGGSSLNGLPPTRVTRLNLLDCYGTFSDKTIVDPFVLRLADVEGTVSDIATGSNAAAEVDLKGTIDSKGLLRVEGRIDAFDYARLTDLDIDLRDVSLPAMSPMSIKFIGHGLLNGDVDLDLDYDVTNGALVGANHIEADDLELGDKVEGEGMFDLPFKLGVALLKDKEGRITLDIPLQGNLDDEGFGLGTAIESAIQEVISELVKSPFRLLSKIGGSGNEDLEFVEFRAGESELDDHAISNLEVLATAMVQRPTLNLVVEGTIDDPADTAALKERSLAAALIANGATEEQLADGAPLEILKTLYQAQFSAAELQGVRESFVQPSESSEVNSPQSLSVDENAFRQALQQALVAAQPFDPEQLQALGRQRATAIQRFLIEQGGLGNDGITIAPDLTVVENDGTWIPCRLIIDSP